MSDFRRFCIVTVVVHFMVFAILWAETGSPIDAMSKASDVLGACAFWAVTWVAVFKGRSA